MNNTRLALGIADRYTFLIKMRIICVYYKTFEMRNQKGRKSVFRG